MKYLKQFLIILIISFIGEILHALIPLPIPASIYGIILMFVGLSTKIIPLDSVKLASKFLIEIMPVMFIPAAVGLIDSWDIIQPGFWQYIIITVVTTVLVMGVSGLVTQLFVRNSNKRKEHQND